MMKPFDLRLCSTLATVALAGSAESHNISADDWVDTGARGTGTSVVVTHAVLPNQISLAGITSLSFSPGTTMVNAPYEILSQLPNCGKFTCFAGDEYRWGGSQEAVDLIAGYSTSPASVDPLPTAAPLTSAHYNPPFNDLPVLTVLFGYGDPGTACDNFSGQTASLTVNNVTYTATNPCSLKGAPGGENAPFLGAGPGDLTFINGVLQAGTGVGWTKSIAVVAPEIGPGSAASGLTLFLGSILVLRPRTAKKNDLRDYC